MTCRSTSLYSTSPTQISSAPRTISARTSRTLSFVAVTLTLATLSKPNVRRSSRSSGTWWRSSSSGAQTIFYLNTVRPSLSVLTYPYSRLTLVYAQTVPVKYEQVVFCKLSDFQLALYRLFISSPEIQALLRGTDSQPLKAINILKKLCNHPELLDLPGDLRGSEKLLPEGFNGAGASARDRGRNQVVNCEWSGKFLVLER